MPLKAKRHAPRKAAFREGIGSAEDVESEPAEEDMDEIMELEGREKRQDEIEQVAG